MAATVRKATARPESQATSYARQKGQQNAMRQGAFLLVVAAFAIPRIPSPIMGVDWWKSVRPSLVMLWIAMPPDPIDVPISGTVPQYPMLQWLAWALAAFLVFVALTLVMHVGALYAQRTRPLGQPRAYLRVTVPASAPGKPTDALVLQKSLHGLAPPGNPMQPAALPLMLCWTARPERKIQQGLSAAGPETLITSAQKRLLGIRSGTNAVATDDPLLAELQPGRFLCVAEVRTVAGDALPIAVIGKEQTLLAALLPALAPGRGHRQRCADCVGADRRPAVAARCAGAAGAAEAGLRHRRTAGAQGKGVRAGLPHADYGAGCRRRPAGRRRAGADDRRSTGRKRAGRCHTDTETPGQPGASAPPVMHSSPPFLRAQRRVGLVAGVTLAGLLALFLWRSGLAAGHVLLWAIPPLALWLPVLTLAARWRKRVNADLVERHAAISGGLLPPRNPRVVATWWPWLGRVE